MLWYSAIDLCIVPAAGSWRWHYSWPKNNSKTESASQWQIVRAVLFLTAVAKVFSVFAQWYCRYVEYSIKSRESMLVVLAGQHQCQVAELYTGN